MREEKNLEVNEAIFAAGCFWGVEAAFSEIEGVLTTEVGYCGGFATNPTYEQVCSGRTGHAECVRIVFNPQVISFAELLDVFWECHDPSSLNQQGPDIGSQYRSAVFWVTEEQKLIADQDKNHLNQLYKKEGRQVKTEIVKKEQPFYRAEEYHQHYLKKKKSTQHS